MNRWLKTSTMITLDLMMLLSEASWLIMKIPSSSLFLLKKEETILSHQRFLGEPNSTKIFRMMLWKWLIFTFKIRIYLQQVVLVSFWYPWFHINHLMIQKLDLLLGFMKNLSKLLNMGLRMILLVSLQRLETIGMLQLYKTSSFQLAQPMLDWRLVVETQKKLIMDLMEDLL